jgi:single-strand DNA-binding protein
MSANNQIVVIGRAGNDVSEDVRTLASGMIVAEVRLAVNRPQKDAQGNPITDWITCQFWDKNGERLSEFVKKGDLISVSGSLRVDNWEKNGEKRQKYFVHGENFQMLESRKARDERGSAEPTPEPVKAKPKPKKAEMEADDDELPPF